MTLYVRRKAKKSTTTSDGQATEVTNRDISPVSTYTLASDVNGAVNFLDRNGGLESVKQANTNNESDTDMANPYAISPVQVPQQDSKPHFPNYSQVYRKRAARTAQHGAGEASPGDGSGGVGKAGIGNGGVTEDGRIVCDSVNDVTLVDNALYASVTIPSAPLASSSSSSQPAAEAGQARETMYNSTNDFTLIENAIYNS